MLISKTVKVKWASRMKNYYISKGYPFTGRNKEFEVKVEDLPDGSRVEVNVKCDCLECSDPVVKSEKWVNYKNRLREDSKYYCQKCIDNVLTMN